MTNGKVRTVITKQLQRRLTSLLAVASSQSAATGFIERVTTSLPGRQSSDPTAHRPSEPFSPILSSSLTPGVCLFIQPFGTDTTVEPQSRCPPQAAHAASLQLSTPMPGLVCVLQGNCARVVYIPPSVLGCAPPNFHPFSPASPSPV